MAYEYITKYDSPNFGYPRGTRGQNKPKEIIIHWWGSYGASFWGVVNWLCRQGGSSSAHYVVEAGRVACLVNCSDAGWHAGVYSVNMNSIGIECRPEMSDGDFYTVAELIADIWKTYGKLPLRGHKDVAQTRCPGTYYARLGELYNLASTIYAGNAAPKKPSVVHGRSKGKTLETIAREVIHGQWGNDPARSQGLTRAGYDPKAVQAIVDKLMHFDAKTTTPDTKSIATLAQEVIDGKWGNDPERSKNLTRAGYNAQAVQNEVNKRLGITTTTQKTIDQLAREVMRGDWGVNPDRRNRLTRAGYNYQAVQARVEQLFYS